MSNTGGIIFCCLESGVRETLCHIENGLTFKFWCLSKNHLLSPASISHVKILKHFVANFYLSYFELLHTVHVTYFEMSPSLQTAQAARMSYTYTIQHTDVYTISVRRGDAKKLSGHHRRVGEYDIKKGL